MNKIDFCITLNGTNLDLWVPLFFGTLFKHNDTSELCFHVLIKEDVDKKVVDFVTNIEKQYPGRFFIYILPYFKKIMGPDYREVIDFSHDCAVTCEYMMDYCGTSDWVIISHFDMFFTGDLISLIKQTLSEDKAIVGEHRRGMVALNRKTYAHRIVNFSNMSYFYNQKLPSGDGYKLRFGSDSRCLSKDIRVEGFDVLELYELNMRARGWVVNVFSRAIYAKYCQHISQGSGYHNDPLTTQTHRSALQMYLKQNNLTGIN